MKNNEKVIWIGKSNSITNLLTDWSLRFDITPPYKNYNTSLRILLQKLVDVENYEAAEGLNRIIRIYESK